MQHVEGGSIGAPAGPTGALVRVYVSHQKLSSSKIGIMYLKTSSSLPILWTPLLVALALILPLSACAGDTSLTGTQLTPKPAHDFSLTDQRGQTVQLSNLRGNVVALTFIYASCPDVCPLIAQRLRRAYEQLPEQTRQKVALVAITVDPERDTPEILAEFSEKHGLSTNSHWFALGGDRSTLKPIWAAYYVSPGRSAHAEHQSSQGAATATAAATPEPVEILAHTDAIYFIDRDGNQRVLMRSDAAPDDIAANLKALAS